MAWIQDARAMAGRNSLQVHAVADEALELKGDKAQVAVPEHSHPGG